MIGYKSARILAGLRAENLLLTILGKIAPSPA
jgi:hypothetical protein